MSNHAVEVSFHRPSESGAKDFADAYREIVDRLLANGGRPAVYPCSRNLLTVKVRILLSDQTSLRLFVPAKRLEHPTDQEYRADLLTIQKFLEDIGLQAVWVQDSFD